MRSASVGSRLAEPVVAVNAQSGVNVKWPSVIVCLRVEGILVHVGTAGELEGRAARGEVVGTRPGWSSVKPGSGDAERETLVQPRLYELRADLHVVGSVYVVVIGAHSVIGARLRYSPTVAGVVGERIARADRSST